MGSLTRLRLLSVNRSIPLVVVVLVGAALVGCSPEREKKAEATTPEWVGTGVNAVSRPVTGAGVAAVTGLRADGSLQTGVFDLAKGTRLWTRTATMAGRL
ncbi:hypothetical protein ACFQ07_03495, partial [Actinomadura adrarensis]